MKNDRPIKVLIMSVGDYEKNGTVRYFTRIGGIQHCTVCLPKQFECNAESYTNRGVDVFIYDESKYINGSFEFFGFRPRNCGGVGRQGIAEAVENFGDDYICFQIDDDCGGFTVRSPEKKQGKMISSWDNFSKMVMAFQEFYEVTKIDCMARTGASIPKESFVCNRKIFNNFIMRKGNDLNFWGFSALCSDDQRFNIYHNLYDKCPTLTTNYFYISFTQNQGDRKDGNAVLYNSDCSWKKSFGLKMMFPCAIAQYVKKETNRVLFREHIMCSKIYPPIYLEDKNGNITGKL